MLQAKIYEHELEAEARLSTLGLSRRQLISVAEMAAAARNESTENDPAGAGGLFAYIHGTRRLRDVLLPQGWKIDRTDNIEATFDPGTGIKIVYQNVDVAADRNKEPKAISPKGPGVERMVQTANRFLFPEEELEYENRIADRDRRLGADVWLFCVSVREIGGEQDIRAELSCATDVVNSQFAEFIERIFVLTGGDLDPLRRDDDDDDSDEEFPVDISRKK